MFEKCCVPHFFANPETSLDYHAKSCFNSARFVGLTPNKFTKSTQIPNFTHTHNTGRPASSEPAVSQQPSPWPKSCPMTFRLISSILRPTERRLVSKRTRSCGVVMVLMLYVKFLERLRKVESSTRKTKPAATAAAGAVAGTTTSSSAPKKTLRTAGHAVIASTNLGDVETQSPTTLLGSKRGSATTHLSESPAGYLARHETAIYCSELCYYPSAKATFPILKQVDVQISYGSLVAVMGPSGSGKVCLMCV
jgi:hypothetical protein